MSRKFENGTLNQMANENPVIMSLKSYSQMYKLMSQHFEVKINVVGTFFNTFN